jgi:hypothetical protein
MRSNKKVSSNTAAPIFRSIKNKPASDPAIAPGHIGEAAINAAALHQLNRYAKDIEEYVQSSRMDALLNQLQTEMDYQEAHRRG